MKRLASVFAVLLLLSGCATQAERQKQKQDDQASSINVQLGVDYMNRGNMDLADTKLKKALRQNPDSAQAHNAYAVLMDRLGEYDKANDYFQRAVDLAPDDSGIHNNYGAFLCRRGKVKQGLEQLKTALRNPLYQTPEYALSNAGLCELKAGDTEAAKKYFRRALQRNPRLPSALFQLAKLNFDEHNFLSTRAYLSRYRDVAVETPESLWLCVRTEKQLGNQTEAGVCASKLYRFYPDSPEASYLRDPSRYDKP
ncbi:MAG: type IV pilus biogenesis/stability protein PilW [Gammaproteobacteria bacterium]|jgi:type IV pilus assembly protein PilF